MEHWGLINFKINPQIKPNNIFVPKGFNYKTPIYIDSSSLIIDKDNNNQNSFLKDNEVILTDKGREICTLYPINKVSDNIFKSFITECETNNNMLKDSKISRVNFLLKNYRPKCDFCGELCTLDWYITKDNDFDNIIHQKEIKEKKTQQNAQILQEQNLSAKIPSQIEQNKSNNTQQQNQIQVNDKIPLKQNTENIIITSAPDIKPNAVFKQFLLLCENCYNSSDLILPEGLTKEDFELSSIYNIFCREKHTEKIIDKINMEKWTEEEIKYLTEAILKLGDSDWDEIIKYIKTNIKGFKKTKEDCIMCLLQLPIRESYMLKVSEKIKKIYNEEKAFENSVEDLNSNVYDYNNPLNGMINFFSKLLKSYINEDINSKSNQITNKEMKDLIYKTYAQSIEKCQEMKNEEEEEINKIMDTLVYLQLKKIELKMNYFFQFEKLIEFKKQNIKNIDYGLVQEKIKLAIMRIQINESRNQKEKKFDAPNISEEKHENTIKIDENNNNHI